MQQKYLNKIIYQVFVRDETEEGTFKAMESKLSKMKENGADIIYFLPIHEIGVKGKKGSLGCPYAIKDYYSINHEYGNVDDFKALVSKIHSLGMEVMLDMVFRHTSRDSVLIKEHPEFYFKDKEGNFANRIGDWSDVYDLDVEKKEVIDYCVDVLKYYQSLGVDHFRFDVASSLAKDFYIKARKEVKEGTILFGEAIDNPFLFYCRSQNIMTLSPNAMINSGVDCLYHYPNWFLLKKFLSSRDSKDLFAYKVALYDEFAENSNIYIRAIENHDYPRLASYDKGKNFHEALFAFTMFTKGPGFVYSGEESSLTERPSLFEKETLDYKEFDKDFYDFYQRVITWKKKKEHSEIIQTQVTLDEGLHLLLRSDYKDHIELGFFPLSKKEETYSELPVEDGEYKNELTGETVSVKDHALTSEKTIIIDTSSKQNISICFS